ncbi:Na+/solute symporter [Ameyamaea chiangmaiensis NBRC 103196]|uniref:Sodium:solute symporter family protein n=1 Tax=Ameyamaea chiangmaiensis TaxID=442969 RepID=A0A850PCY3_9PROT|nr:sodium:solute symporter family protein [Ameyamaea chiangmaiensis]MBS4074739.1 sodium:solute symporter family protein [Ameyamaea chiangmaiensis]NVN40146.1 sodium:solute symporter family protein [Ameyamaea chiangmaiensis]GBQ62567.1 Na+/solute symporter [Ameyamaea chiangmaiensis NBRC 103196]
MIVTFGLLFVFCAALVVVLQRHMVHDRSFSDYAVGGRSFGTWFQAMSFLNTWWPGGIMLSLTGMAVKKGVIAFYMPIYSLLTVMLMYAMARRVWIWGRDHDLRTQADMLGLRYNSRALGVATSIVGLLSLGPFLVLGFKSLGALFYEFSFGRLPMGLSVLLGVALILLRQIWTIRMGMRGLVISDLYQGILAYGGGTLLALGFIAWLMVAHGARLASLDPALLALPDAHAAQGPLYLFSLIATGVLGGWCIPSIFVRLYTADSVRSMLKAGVFSMPLSLVFSVALVLAGLLASEVPALRAQADGVWFALGREAGGSVGLGLAGIIILAATMGGADASVQSFGTQIANDIVGAFVTLSYRASIVTAKGGMVAVMAVAGWLSTLAIPNLVTIAILGYQGIIQLAVVQYGGLFWRRGNATGALVGLCAGFATAAAIELDHHGDTGWSFGLTSGLIGLGVNLALYILCAFMFAHTPAEQQRLATLFDGVPEQAVPDAQALRLRPEPVA